MVIFMGKVPTEAKYGPIGWKVLTRVLLLFDTIIYTCIIRDDHYPSIPLNNRIFVYILKRNITNIQFTIIINITKLMHTTYNKTL